MTVNCYNKAIMESNQDFSNKYTIEELSELTGFSRRTIRYYIQENIIEAPAGRGRGGFYFDSHLSKLRKIKELQEKGLNLDSISKVLHGQEPELRVCEGGLPFKENPRQPWVRYQIADGIELNIRRDIEEKDFKKINEILRIASLIAGETDK